MKNNNLILEKTHDFCASGKPTLAVVAIHGIASNSSTYDSILNFLENKSSLKNVRFITFDLLGSGKSIKSDEFDYGYDDQLNALKNSIDKLDLNIPLILIGHSLGSLIVANYADRYKDDAKKIILISPPIYKPENLDKPDFIKGIEAFKEIVGIKNKEILGDKAFNNSMEKIILNQHNYQLVSSLNTDTTIVYGDADRFIDHGSIKEIEKTNSHITAYKTVGGHGITPDKYIRVYDALKEEVNA